MAQIINLGLRGLQVRALPCHRVQAAIDLSLVLLGSTHLGFDR